MRRKATPHWSRARNLTRSALTRPSVTRPSAWAAAVVLLAFVLCSPAYGQAGAITGTVTADATGEPIPGVNVVIEGTQQGAATSAQGEYTISGVEAGTYTLVASFVGYGEESEEGVEVRAEETTTVDFVMQQELAGLDELVVVGYGEQQRRDLTGSVSQVTAEDLEDLPATRVDQALQGRASGVQVTQSSGAPGGDVTVRIRGTNSINAGSDPLFVIDGFPGVGDLNSINPNNIESIQVLKGPSATAIYGARGAGGVVLITTKQGRAGESRVDFNASYGLQNASKTLPLLNAEQYARLVNEARANIGQEPAYENPASLGEGTDWQDQVLQAAPRQEYQLSFSGGSEDVQYFISGSYLDEGGILIGSDFDRGALRINLNSDLSEKLTVGNQLTLSRTGTNLVGGGERLRNALIFNPLLPVREEDGTYTRFRVPQISLDNPVAQAVEPQVEITTYQGLGNLFAEYSIIDGLDLRISVGGNYNYNEDQQYTPTTLLEGLESGGEANVSTTKNVQWVSENTLTFDRMLGERHDFEFLGGYTLQKERIESVTTGSREFVNNQLGYRNLSGGSIQLIPQSGTIESTLSSFLFRTNYVLDDKYLFTATARYDGSSRFGAGNRYGFFPSGSVAWRLSEEPFLESADFLTDLKVRTSYGITGNQNIGAYAARAALSTQSAVFGRNQGLQVGIGPARVANEDLKWETTAQLDVGIDATFLDGNLSITGDYYRKVTNDLLLAVSLPVQTGFSSTLRNVGSVRNSGFEFSLSSQNTTGAFSWSTSFNFSTLSNEVVELGADESFFANVNVADFSSVNQNTILVREGEPLGSFYGYVSDGLFRSEEEIVNSAQPQAHLGEERFRDLNGDGQITADDKRIIGSGQPSAYGGITNTFSYGGVQLSVFLSGSYGSDIFNSTRVELESVSGATNNLATVLDRWSPDNPDGTLPRALATGYPLRASTRYIEDGSYLRIQNVSLSYNIPQGWAETLQFRTARVYLTGTNLYTFTGYSGYDPEINFAGGSNTAFSVDYNPYPRARTFTMGVNLGF